SNKVRTVTQSIMAAGLNFSIYGSTLREAISCFGGNLSKQSPGDLDVFIPIWQKTKYDHPAYIINCIKEKFNAQGYSIDPQPSLNDYGTYIQINGEFGFAVYNFNFQGLNVQLVMGEKIPLNHDNIDANVNSLSLRYSTVNKNWELCNIDSKEGYQTEQVVNSIFNKKFIKGELYVASNRVEKLKKAGYKLCDTYKTIEEDKWENAELTTTTLENGERQVKVTSGNDYLLSELQWFADKYGHTIGLIKRFSNVESANWNIRNGNGFESEYNLFEILMTEKTVNESYITHKEQFSPGSVVNEVIVDTILSWENSEWDGKHCAPYCNLNNYKELVEQLGKAGYSAVKPTKDNTEKEIRQSTRTLSSFNIPCFKYVHDKKEIIVASELQYFKNKEGNIVGLIKRYTTGETTITGMGSKDSFELLMIDGKYADTITITNQHSPLIELKRNDINALFGNYLSWSNSRLDNKNVAAYCGKCDYEKWLKEIANEGYLSISVQEAIEFAEQQKAVDFGVINRKVAAVTAAKNAAADVAACDADFAADIAAARKRDAKRASIKETKETKMTEKETPARPDLVTLLKKDGKDAQYRLVRSQLLNGAKALVLAIVSKDQETNPYMESVAQVMDTKAGEAFLSSLVGMGLTFAPGEFMQDARIQLLAEEFRVNGLHKAEDAIMSSIMSALTPTIMQTISNSLESLPDVEEEAPLLKKNQKTEEEIEAEAEAEMQVEAELEAEAKKMNAPQSMT
ncbi:MAG TPA: hypothetical protein VMX17_10360, partial [Candidatus Glassbacteria bacterium]|nr:hypothetical protein [Candidatus Glassbacteria bacterium]